MLSNKILSVENKHNHTNITLLGFIKIAFKNKEEIEINLKELRRKDKKEALEIVNRIKHNKKCRVAFYVFEIAKWKTDSLFQLMLQDERFEPFIVLGMTPGRNRDFSQGLKQRRLKEQLDFFNKRGYKVFVSYSTNQVKTVPLKEYNPDVVFFQQHVGNDEINSINQVKKYALCCYVPYYVPNYINLEYDYDSFCSRLFRFYTLNDKLKAYYETLNNAIDNIYVTGHTALDYYYLNRGKHFENKYVIYAPHFSMMHPNIKNKFYYSTFARDGERMLEFAKQHSEISWVFKPHPNLKEFLRKMLVPEESIESYYKEWAKFAIVSEDADYTELFANSRALITDCGSFTSEYFATGKPLLHLINPLSVNIPCSATKPMFDSFYKIYNDIELYKEIERVIINNDDYKKQDRIRASQEVNFTSTYAARNILNDLIITFWENK